MTRQKAVGIPTAFTYHYPGVKFLVRFLEKAGVRVVKSGATTPEILQAGTTYSSSDYCVPLRVYVGHVHTLATKHPELDFIVTPILVRENDSSATCSKYRDVGGASIRSLTGVGGYLEARRSGAASAAAGQLRLPPILEPVIDTLDELPLRNLCYRLYADIHGLSWKDRYADFFLPGRAGSPRRQRVEAAFREAHREVLQAVPADPEARMAADPHRVRLALVGRDYLLDDPAVTSDLVRYFRRQKALLLTARDVPFERLAEGYRRTEGFYDTHKLFKAFIDHVVDRVDGFVLAGSFGCHPDAFLLDHLAEYIREKGAPAWVFKYDEQAGSAGFQTRYETVRGFLEKRRDERVAGRTYGEGDAPAPPAPAAPPNKKTGDPLLVWPHMGPILDLVVEEVMHQAGLSAYLHRPRPLSEETIQLGNYRFTESCSPYACSTGSLIETVREATGELAREAERAGRPVEPRRILMLQARGVGPCTFGWYALMQAAELPKIFREEAERYGHSIEMATMGLDGIVEFVRELARLGNPRRLRGFLAYAAAMEVGLDRLPFPKRSAITLNLLRSIRSLTRTAWAKLYAGEALRARSLIVRAHERSRGDTTLAFGRGIEILRQAHTPGEIKKARAAALALLEAVPRDHEIKPRVVAVGEIYVLLTSFANRGTVENLLGKEGIEVEEGLHLSDFLKDSLLEMRRRAYLKNPLVRLTVDFLLRHNVDVAVTRPRVRGPEARPFAWREMGGEGIKSVAKARRHVEGGADGIVHVYPFKCMPEGLAKDALAELSSFYGVRYLPLSFDKETDIERLKTEVGTFAAILRLETAQKGREGPEAHRRAGEAEQVRRRRLGADLVAEALRLNGGRHL